MNHNDYFYLTKLYHMIIKEAITKHEIVISYYELIIIIGIIIINNM